MRERPCGCAACERICRTRPLCRRQRKTAQGRAWGASMLGVCAGSLAFHASSGDWRSAGRKVDYWAIAASSCEQGLGSWARGCASYKSCLPRATYLPPVPRSARTPRAPRMPAIPPQRC